MKLINHTWKRVNLKLLLILCLYLNVNVNCQIDNGIYSYNNPSSIISSNSINNNLTNSSANERVTNLNTNNEIELRVLTRLGSNYEFPIITSNRIMLWLLYRQTNLTYSMPKPTILPAPLFEIGNIRDPKYVMDYPCSPSDTNCTKLSINTVNLSDIGTYVYRSQSASYSLSTVTFYVSTFNGPLMLDCVDNSSCAFNSTTKILSVLPDTDIILTCSIVIVLNDNYEIPAEIKFYNKENQETCLDVPTTKTNLTKSEVKPELYENANGNNLLYVRLSKTCKTQFTKQNDLNSNYKCALYSSNNSLIISQGALQADQESFKFTGSYETLVSTLDIQYLEQDGTSQYPFSQSLFAGNSPRYDCPFSASPMPIYSWKLINSTASNTTTISLTQFLNEFNGKILSIPATKLEVGSYELECTAATTGLSSKSQSQRFQLNVKAQPVNTPKKGITLSSESRFIQNSSTNVGAIVGGVVGGVVFLLILILLIIFIIRYTRNKKNPKDEVEKAKEIDIDITDHNGNPHINNLQGNNINRTGGQAKQTNGQANGIGHKVIAGLMVPTSTAQSYAAIAHAAAAAAQSNLQRNNMNNFINQNPNSSSDSNGSNNFSSGSANNLFSANSNNNLLNNSKSQSYNNPGFYESTSYTIQNPLESPPPYDAALQQPIKKDSPLQQRLPQNQQLLQQQKDYMGSSSKLLSGANTPTQPKHAATSLSYTASPANNNLSLVNTGISSSLQQLQFQQQMQQQPNTSNLHYTTVENRARNRNPLNGLHNEIDNQQAQQQTQYSTMVSANPIDV